VGGDFDHWLRRGSQIVKQSDRVKVSLLERQFRPVIKLRYAQREMTSDVFTRNCRSFRSGLDVGLH
jgi:hypothetical protein